MSRAVRSKLARRTLRRFHARWRRPAPVTECHPVLGRTSHGSNGAHGIDHVLGSAGHRYARQSRAVGYSPVPARGPLAAGAVVCRARLTMLAVDPGSCPGQRVGGWVARVRRDPATAMLACDASVAAGPVGAPPRWTGTVASPGWLWRTWPRGNSVGDNTCNEKNNRCSLGACRVAERCCWTPRSGCLASAGCGP